VNRPVIDFGAAMAYAALDKTLARTGDLIPETKDLPRACKLLVAEVVETLADMEEIWGPTPDSVEDYVATLKGIQACCQTRIDNALAAQKENGDG
jgi:hypothetical protein